MAEPNTGGQLRTRIADMQVGDYIKYYGALAASPWNFYIDSAEVGETTRVEAPLTGTNIGGVAYFIKVDKGLLITDRVLLHSVSWDTLNTNERIQGFPTILQSIPGYIRSLGGGNSYASATGASQTTDAVLGAWPTDNEWDTYIVKKDYGNGAGRDDVWHFSSSSAFCQEGPIISINNSGARVRRGGTVNSTYFSVYEPAYTNSSIGFRPVFQYEEEVTP